MNTIFLFELKKWLRSKAVWLVFILWVTLVSFAAWQRHTVVQTLASNMNSSRQHELEKEHDYYSQLDSVDKGWKQIKEYINDPHNPVYFNTKMPRFAIYKPGALDLFATGQSDIFPQLYVISYRTDYRQQKEEAVNGLQLLYGKLDIAFVLVFLLPLIIIALNYNVLSQEKENGTLRMLLAQNTSLKQLAFGKLLVSFSFSFLLLLVPVVAAAICSVNIFSILSAISIYFLAGLLYSGFWHLLCALVNSRLKSSAWNATALTGCWLALALVFPAIISLLAGVFHPVASRAKFIVDYRQAITRIEQDSNNAVLDKFFFDHPELVKEDTTGNEKNRANIFYKASHAKQDKVQSILQPIYDDYNKKLRAANEFSNNTGLLSPPVILQQSLLLLAGQSSRQYLYFTTKIDQWRKPYFEFILAKLLQDKAIDKAEALQWQAFDDATYDYTDEIRLNILALLLFNAAVLIITSAALGRTRIEK